MSVLAGARSAARFALIRGAADYTSQAQMRSALVVAPHPDDETIGCGGRIVLARRSGVPVTVVVATDGAASHDNVGKTADQLRQLRHDELIRATGCLGVAADDVVELGHPDGALADHVEALTSELMRLIVEHRPDDVYSTSVWEAHPDHAAAGRALREAMKRLAAGGMPAAVVPAAVVSTPEGFVLPRHFEYPIWLWGDWPVSRRWLRQGPKQWWSLRSKSRCHVVELAEVADRKWSAMQAYASQLGDAVDGIAVGLPESLLKRAQSGPELFFDVYPTRYRQV